MYYQKVLRSGPVDAAGTVTTAIEDRFAMAIALTLHAVFDYGSGGTKIICFLEGSYDGGTTWVSVGNVTFTTADNAKLFQVVPTALDVTDADATQADDTVLNHIPNRLRLRTVTTGTYVASTLMVALVAR